MRGPSGPIAGRRRAGEGTVESYGGLDAAHKKIYQLAQENPASNGREEIDDFRLRGSRTWRRMSGHLTKGWRIQAVHDFDNCKFALSEGEARTAVVWDVPENPHGTGFPAFSTRGANGAVPGAVPSRPVRRGVAQEGEMVEGATLIFGAGAPQWRVKGDRQNDTLTLPFSRDRSLHMIPAGRPKC